MSNMKINGKTLRNLRKKKGWSQQALGEKAGVSARQISRIEKGKVKLVRTHTLKCLSKALGVNPEKLSKETHHDDIHYEWRQIPIPREVYAHMNTLEFLYGISKFDQIRLFPLLIALVSEWSKLWYKNKLRELQEAVNEIKRLASENSSLRFAYQVYLVEEGIAGAEEALEKRGPYDPDWAKEIKEYALDDTAWEEKHPFVEFLLDILEKAQSKYIKIYINEDNYTWPIPDYSIAAEIIEKLSAGDDVIRMAISKGFISLKDIPAELWPEDSDCADKSEVGGDSSDINKVEKRKNFIQKHLPESFWRYYEAEKAFLNEFFSDSDAEDGNREE